MFILMLCVSIFFSIGILLSWRDEVKQRRERRERLNARTRRVLKNR